MERHDPKTPFEGAADLRAAILVAERTATARTPEQAAQIALDTVRDAFGFAVGTYWKVGVGEEPRSLAAAGPLSSDGHDGGTTAPVGRNIIDEAWHRRDLVFVAELGGPHGERARHSHAGEGSASAFALPVVIADDVAGVMVFATHGLTHPSPERIEALRSVGRLVSTAIGRVALEQRAQQRTEQELERLTEFTFIISKLNDELTQTAREMTDTTQRQGTVSQEQAVAIAELTTTLSELKLTAAQAMAKATAVIDVSERSMQRAGDGMQVVDAAIAAMKEIRDKVEGIADRILSLSEQTQQIGDIIASVGEIAEQSKLLALNAAIEAARAGEHGKGFAVVATEIRSLADQSKQSTAQVRKILGDIQRATNAAVVATEEGTREVESGVTLAQRAGETIHALNESISEAVEAARLIAAAARQQATGVKQASEAIGTINANTQAMVDGLRAAELTSASLNTTVDALATLLMRSRTTLRLAR